jgi:hypothetical protein
MSPTDDRKGFCGEPVTDDRLRGTCQLYVSLQLSSELEPPAYPMHSRRELLVNPLLGTSRLLVLV